jgi:hypothetical protein
MLNRDTEEKLADLAQRVWKSRKIPMALLNTPTVYLEENGIEVPAGFEVQVLSNRDWISFQFQPPSLAGGHNKQSRLPSHQAAKELIVLRYEFKLVWE